MYMSNHVQGDEELVSLMSVWEREGTVIKPSGKECICLLRSRGVGYKRKENELLYKGHRQLLSVRALWCTSQIWRNMVRVFPAVVNAPLTLSFSRTITWLCRPVWLASCEILERGGSLLLIFLLSMSVSLPVGEVGVSTTFCAITLEAVCGEQLSRMQQRPLS